MIEFATPDYMHLILFKLYTMESFIYKSINAALRKEDLSHFENLLPFYIMLQHSLFIYYKNEQINNDIKKNVTD